MFRTLAMLSTALGLLAPITSAGELTVVSVDPAINASNVSVNAPISVHFNMPVMRSTATTANFWAFARWSGAVGGTIAFADGDQSITLTHPQAF